MNIRNLLMMVFVAACCALPSFAAEKPTEATPLTLPVWPAGQMPGNGAKEPEAVRPSKDEFTRITNVSEPSLTVFRASASAKPTPAVLICPGGGYSYVVVDKEGFEIAAWLNTLGITGIVLKYRTPSNRAGAFQDIERAMRLVRSRAKEWNVDSGRIGAMGFSAGGHLCARLSTNYSTSAYANVDEVDRLSCRPDFVVLVYPAYLGKDGQLAAELPVSDKVPPTLIVHSEDDRSFIAGSKIYEAALTQSGVPHEYALFETGGHGYGLHCLREAKEWPERCHAWWQKLQIV